MPEKRPARSPFANCKWCGGPIEWKKMEGKWTPNVVGTETRHFCKNGKPVNVENKQEYDYLR